MENNINSRKNITQTTPIQYVTSYIKENYKIKSEEDYDDGTETKMIAFEEDELVYIVDVYPTKPQHLRVYILFDETSKLELLNKANAKSRFAKGSFIEQKNGVRLCVEVEQMMYGLNTKASAEKYTKLATQYLVKFMEILTELEEESAQEED